MTSGTWRYILHADMDAFYASVEQMDDPSLDGKPLVVGGPPESRGVVAAASYEARRYGIHSAMPMRTALRLCPELARVSPHFDRYRQVSDQVMDIFRDATPVLEPLSLDEAYLDVSERVSPEKVGLLAFDLKARVMREVGLVVTIGGGVSKTVAKVASQVAKPNGLLLVQAGETASFLAPLAIDILPGVGPRSAAVLKGHGIDTMGELARCDEAWLRQMFGRRGPELKERALGVDRSPVTPHRETRSVSAETTMPQDVESETTLAGHIEELARSVAERLQGKGLVGKTVWIKLRLADFRTFTRQTTLRVPTSDARTISMMARELLRREMQPDRKFRLVGVGVTNLCDSFQLPLLPLDSLDP